MSAARYVSILMSSRNQAHTFHLLTNKYSTHKALEGYYESIVPLLDAWSEAYMGKYGRFPKFKIFNRVSTDAKKAPQYFKSILSAIKRLHLPKDSYLQSIQDEITVLIRSTLYKLSLK